MLFSIAHRAEWDDARAAVRVAYSLDRDSGFVVVELSTFARLFGRKLSPVQCVQAYHQHRSEFEMVAEALCRSGIVEPNGDIVIEAGDLRDP